MEAYSFFVKNLAINQVSKEFLNQDQQHALEVFVNIFNTATKEIRIFAACLCSDTEDDTTYVANKTEYIVALSNFIERGGQVYILLNHFNKMKALKSNLMRRLAYYMSEDKYKEQVQIRSTSTRLHFTGDTDKNEVHFTVMDNRAYRIETNITERAATCNFNNPDMAKSLTQTFDSLFGSSEVLALTKLFNEI